MGCTFYLRKTRYLEPLLESIRTPNRSLYKKRKVDNLTKSTPINALQCGIRSFGWGVYMLFIIVDNSKIRVPKQFSGLSVNKGVIKDWVNKDEAKITFNYGGTLITNMNEKIVIG